MLNGENAIALHFRNRRPLKPFSRSIMKEDSRWSVATGEDSGRPLIFRIRNEPPPFSNQAEFPYLLAISWSFDVEANNGMPMPQDVRRMTELEDLLEKGLELPGEAFLSVAVTGNGVREWQWYARNRDTVMKLINKTLGHLEPFPIQFSFQDDPVWQGYNGFLENVAPPA